MVENSVVDDDGQPLHVDEVGGYHNSELFLIPLLDVITK